METWIGHLSCSIHYTSQQFTESQKNLDVAEKKYVDLVQQSETGDLEMSKVLLDQN